MPGSGWHFWKSHARAADLKVLQRLSPSTDLKSVPFGQCLWMTLEGATCWTLSFGQRISKAHQSTINISVRYGLYLSILFLYSISRLTFTGQRAPMVEAAMTLSLSNIGWSTGQCGYSFFAYSIDLTLLPHRCWVPGLSVPWLWETTRNLTKHGCSISFILLSRQLLPMAFMVALFDKVWIHFTTGIHGQKQLDEVFCNHLWGAATLERMALRRPVVIDFGSPWDLICQNSGNTLYWYQESSGS